MKAGKSSNQALLRTLANKDALNFATRRLIRDLKEFENNTIPTVGVSARPMDDDLFTWHANLKGPEGTAYEGGVFHIELRIPEDYPRSPPDVELLVDLPHPNVFGRKVCLDMLEKTRKEGVGWSSGYSIMSVLIQLQSFLFEQFYDEVKRDKEIKKAIDNANQFKCTRRNCKHGGRLAAWPAFDNRETSSEAFKILESERELFKNELVCYHTKMTQEENPLGLGLDVSRIARTGLIKQASPCLDYISLKAFIKEGIRNSSNNEHFKYWLPLFFGTQWDKILHLGKKSVSMICTGYTKRFREEMLLDLFPKMMVTLGVQIMNEKRHASILIFRILFHVHYLYLAFLNEYPHLKDVIKRKIKEFCAEEEKRHKDAIPSLGAFLSDFIVEWDSMDSSIEPILQEQLDRQVLWMLKKVPELEDDSNDGFLDDKRAMICFKSQQASYQLVVFWVMLSKFFATKFKTTQQLMDHYRDNLGRLGNEFENEIQKKSFEILKIENYDEMYKYIGRKITEKELNDSLKQAIKNSKRRKYHGTEDEINALPSKEEQMNELMKDVPKLTDYINAESKTLKEVNEDEWRKACISRWLWIRSRCERGLDLPTNQPNALAVASDSWFNTKLTKQKERLVELKEEYMRKHEWTDEIPSESVYGQDFKWRDLFIKLDVEEHLLQIDNTPEFPSFYLKLQACQKFISSLIVPIVTVKNLKSGHYYLTALFTNLKNLKKLQLVGIGQASYVNASALKAIAKGINNFISKGGQVSQILYNKLNVTGNVNDVAETLWTPLRKLTSLTSIELNSTNVLTYKGAKAISEVIASHKNLKELILVATTLTDSDAKEIADGLMRAKQLEVLRLRANPSLTSTGLNSIVYNLAFSPRLLHLDIAQTNTYSNTAVLVESIYKLLRISASLEILNLASCSNLNNNLTEQFFISVGENRTLKKLFLNHSGVFTSDQCTKLGKAIAFNAKKQGSLEVITLQGGAINSYANLGSLYNGMLVSPADYESWYGDSSKVSKMSGQDFAKTYYNNLRVLQLEASNYMSGFDLANYKKQLNPIEPHFAKLIRNSPHLTDLHLQSTFLNKQDADLLHLALDLYPSNVIAKIQVLNLSRNNLTKEGAKTLAQVLEKNNVLQSLDLSHNVLGVSGAKSIAASLINNKSLKYLNLFANKIDVDGARAFEATLKSNSSLEYIDFGHNRLRNEGLLAIAKGLAANKTSAVKYLGLKFNFIDADGFIVFLKKVFAEGNKPVLREIFVKNNSINELGLVDVQKVYQKLNVSAYVDAFDKFHYVKSDYLERTVWVHPAPGDETQIKNLFEVTGKCGIVLSVRKRQGPKWPNRTQQANSFYFVEFASPISVVRALQLASRRQAIIGGTTLRVLKAGTGTYNYIKSKKKTASQTKFAGRPGRGGRGGRARGGRARRGR